jgi:polyisoprenoid-binding protein YceI
MKRLIRFCSLAVVFVALSSNGFANENYKFSQSGSTIAFQIHQFLGTVRGKFTRFEGKIIIDREHIERSSVGVTIQTGSINTGIAARDEHLRGSELFDVAKYPAITFKSRSVKQTGRDSADIAGDLTMHGTTRPITLHVKLLTPLTQQTSMSRTRWQVTTGPIKRRDFGLMWSSSVEAISMISQDVVPRIEIEASRAE